MNIFSHLHVDLLGHDAAPVHDGVDDAQTVLAIVQVRQLRAAHLQHGGQARHELLLELY